MLSNEEEIERKLSITVNDKIKMTFKRIYLAICFFDVVHGNII
jgi:hypothetical protein